MNTKNIRPLLVLISTLLLLSPAHGEIRATVDLQEIKQEIFSSAKDTLVIFDVDMVLIMPEDKILLKQVSGESKPFLAAMRNQCHLRHAKKMCDALEGIILQSRHMLPVTTETTAVFDEIQEHGYRVLGLTLSKTGRFGNVRSTEQLRIDELKALGFIFKQPFPALKPRQLKRYLPESAELAHTYGCSACAKGGIVFTCHAPKGAVLNAYLQAIKYKPEKIIFIDDKIENLSSVGQFCAQEKIAYIGFEYNTAKVIAAQFPLDLQTAGLQFAILEKFSVWLSDADIAEIFQESVV